MLINQSIIPDIKAIIATAQERAIRAVDTERTLMYWNIGKRIFEEEQQGKDRAEYGTYLIKFLSEELQPEYGSGFSVRQIQWYRQFYRTFPIVSALRTQLSWTQYKLLLAVDNQDKREFYIAETVKNNWTVRQLERQINSSLYERLLLRNKKKTVVRIGEEGKFVNGLVSYIIFKGGTERGINAKMLGKRELLNTAQNPSEIIIDDKCPKDNDWEELDKQFKDFLL